jgi:hypothetical protein
MAINDIFEVPRIRKVIELLQCFNHSLFKSIAGVLLYKNIITVKIKVHFNLYTEVKDSWYNNYEMTWQPEICLFNANPAIFQLYHGENKLIFNEMMTRSAFY